MIIKIDKKEIDIYKEACFMFGMTFQEYTIEANESMVAAEIMLDAPVPLEPNQNLCLLLGRQVQMNWQKQVEKDTEVFKSAWRGTTTEPIRKPEPGPTSGPASLF